jgi:molybdopterin synthase catalytic subunit
MDGSKRVRELSDPAAGARVTFAGNVRRTNRDRNVVRLEYEAAEDLARNEFARIAEEARQRFDITDLQCVHRVGSLEVGETAVWIEVLAPHRGDAFDACRFLIDQLKLRLPIWKKEFYTDGESDWIEGA